MALGRGTSPASRSVPLGQPLAGTLSRGGGAAAAPNVTAVGGPPERYGWRLYIGHAGGRLALFEYDANGRRRKSLTYQNARKGRPADFYEVDDLMFVRELSHLETVRE